jgi:arginine exporter protein ArgO
LKEVLDVIVWIGFAFILFIFLRGMNDTQTQKNLDKLEEIEKKKQKKIEEEEKSND